MVARILRGTDLALVLATVLVAPLPQGLFYPVQYRSAVAVVALGFVLWGLGGWLGGRRLAPAVTGVDAAGLALLTAYLLASFVAVYAQGHLDVLLQLLAALMAFFLIREEVAHRPALRPTAGWLVAGAGLAVAAVALVPYSGRQPLDEEALELLKLVGAGGRPHASFEYPNTAAAFFEAAALLAAGQAVYARRRFLAYGLAAGAAYTLSVAFVLSASRGALLVLPVAVVVAVVGLPAGRRLPASLLFVGPLVASAATARGFMANGALGDWPRARKWFSTGAIGSVADGLALAALLSIPPRPRRWLAGNTAAGAAALLAIGAVARAGGPDALVRRYLPPHAARLLDLNWCTSNALLRLSY